jgi:hypothetical protein
VECTEVSFFLESVFFFCFRLPHVGAGLPFVFVVPTEGGKEVLVKNAKSTTPFVIVRARVIAKPLKRGHSFSVSYLNHKLEEKELS